MNFNSVCEYMGINQISFQEMYKMNDVLSMSSDFLKRYITPHENSGTFTPTRNKMIKKNSQLTSPTKKDLTVISIEELHRNYENSFTNKKSPSQNKQCLKRKTGVLNLLELVPNKFTTNKLSFKLNKSKKSLKYKGSLSIPEISNSFNDQNSKKMILEKTNTEKNLKNTDMIVNSKFKNKLFKSEKKTKNDDKKLLLGEDLISLNKSFSNNQSQRTSSISNNFQTDKNKNNFDFDNKPHDNSKKNINRLIQPGQLPTLLPRTPLNLSMNNGDSQENDIYDSNEISIDKHMAINKKILSPDNLNLQKNYNKYVNSSSPSVKIHQKNEDTINYNLNVNNDYSINRVDNHSQNSTILMESNFDDQYDDLFMSRNGIFTENNQTLKPSTTNDM